MILDFSLHRGKLLYSINKQNNYRTQKRIMLILTESTRVEFMVKNSRFVAEAVYVETPEAAREFWRQQKTRYDNGNHIVYAFITGPQGNVMGCSDDGEPSGTAGRPMLAVLKGSGITNVIVTAARWFGGTKLGTGGLVRAYSDCARLALEDPPVRELIAMRQLAFHCSYADYEKVKHRLGQLHFRIEREEFTEQTVIHGEIPEQDAEALIADIREMTADRCRIG